jgi:hypothetical protein
VKVIGAAKEGVKVSAAALVRLAHLSTLRRLEVVDAGIVEDAPTGGPERDSGLEEVRFQEVTPLSREFVGRFLGASTRAVFVGPFSNHGQTASPPDNAARFSPREVHLDDITLPVFPSGLEGRLLGCFTTNLA